MNKAEEALTRLRDGNRRFVTGEGVRDSYPSPARRAEIAEAQEPFAILLGCADSRVPAEIVFDQGLGDLFVIRVAGNIVAPSQIGSVEFAAAQYGTRLVVVLGHTDCGAVHATIDALQTESGAQKEGPPESTSAETSSQNLRSIVDRIRPAIVGLMDSGLHDDHGALLEKAVRANINHSVDHLRHGSEVLEGLIQEDGLVVVGAEYSLETGEVQFLDAPTTQG